MTSTRPDGVISYNTSLVMIADVSTACGSACKGKRTDCNMRMVQQCAVRAVKHGIWYHPPCADGIGQAGSNVSIDTQNSRKGETVTRNKRLNATRCISQYLLTVVMVVLHCS
jgi:hypothetical protein